MFSAMVACKLNSNRLLPVLAASVENLSAEIHAISEGLRGAVNIRIQEMVGRQSNRTGKSSAYGMLIPGIRIEMLAAGVTPMMMAEKLIAAKDEFHPGLVGASAEKTSQAKSEMPQDLATVNVRSPKQLQAWFTSNADAATQTAWPKTPKGGFDFSRKGLGAAPSGAIRNALLKVANARSGLQRGGMVASRDALISPATGCVHASFKLLGTDAGRLSSSGPNVQQLPPGERKAYVARPGYKFVDADAGGLQLRIAAVFGVESMAHAFLQGVDLHALAGGGIDINDPERDAKIAAVDEQSRKSGKAANFSLLFGMSIRTFHARLRSAVDESLTEEDAARVYRAWYQAWPEVAGMQTALFDEARRNGYSTTPGGRIRDYLRDGVPNWHQIRNITLNASIQGADADLIMLVAAYLDIAMIRFEGASIAVLVHDEVLIECKEGDAEEVAKVLDTAWRWAWAQLFPHRLDLGSMSPAFCQPTIGRSFGDV
jgi:DNA polymerase I-like protein with 3'-5' exonuclease and polymerase domains